MDEETKKCGAEGCDQTLTAETTCACNSENCNKHCECAAGCEGCECKAAEPAEAVTAAEAAEVVTE